MSTTSKHKYWRYIVRNPTDKDWKRFNEMPGSMFQYMIFGIRFQQEDPDIRFRPEEPDEDNPEPYSELYGIIELRHGKPREYVQGINPHASWCLVSPKLSEWSRLRAQVKNSCDFYLEHGRFTTSSYYNFPQEIVDPQETRSKPEIFNPREVPKDKDVMNDPELQFSSTPCPPDKV